MEDASRLSNGAGHTSEAQIQAEILQQKVETRF